MPLTKLEPTKVVEALEKFSSTLDPTAVLDALNAQHIVYEVQSPHKDVFVWRGKLCNCEEDCIISAGFAYLPKEPWSRFSVLIPSHRRPGEMLTYCFSTSPAEIARLVSNALHEEHRKGCVLPKRNFRKPLDLGF